MFLLRILFMHFFFVSQKKFTIKKHTKKPGIKNSIDHSHKLTAALDCWLSLKSCLLIYYPHKVEVID